MTNARIRLVVAQEETFAEIIDDGPGLPDHELQRTLEPFYRSADARTSVKQGPGLGFAVCRLIARAPNCAYRWRSMPTGRTASRRNIS